MRQIAVFSIVLTLSFHALSQDESRLSVGQRGDSDFLKAGAMPGKVTVYVNGKETAGMTRTEQGGNREFSMPVPKGASVKLVAQDGDDWVFVRWVVIPGMLLAEAAKEEDPANAVRMLEQNSELSFTFTNNFAESADAEFSYRPGFGKIDLVADYNAFLREIKLTETEAELDGDNGGQEYNTTLPGTAEVGLINAAMKQRNTFDNMHDCVDPSEVWQSFCKNIKELDKALPMTSLEARRALAALANTSSTDYEFWDRIEELVKEGYGVDLGDVHWDTTGGGWFGSNGNADGDFPSNVKEWLAALEEVGTGADMNKRVQVFTEMALDPRQPAR